MYTRLTHFLPLLLLLIVVPAVFAGSASMHVSLTPSDIHMPAPCCGTILAEEYRLTVDADGIYTFTLENSTLPVLNQNFPLALIYNECGFDPGNYTSGLFGALNNTETISLTAGTYTVAFMSRRGSDSNGGQLITGSYDATVSGPGNVSFSAGCITPGSGAEASGDPDGDGIYGARDNCPYDFNPDQEDGWGSLMGDACDSDWYNMSGIGLSGYEQKDGTYNLHGNCRLMAGGSPRCPVIASFDPATLSSEATPLVVTSDEAGAWSVVIHYLHSNNGPAVFQVNVYSTNPPRPDTLLDDRLEIHVNSDGSWQWYQRGGSSVFNGI